MITPTAEDWEPSTTSGTIAVLNLQAQINGLARRTRRVRPARGQAASLPGPVTDRALLIDLIALRGHVLGCIADYELAAKLAEQLVRDAPDNGTALLARARTRATFDRFVQALADLDTARRAGVDGTTLDDERAAIYQAVGSYAHALVLRHNAAKRRPGFTTISALAVLQAERGEVAEAERLFAEARRRYHGVSPFPVASLDVRRGLMWLRADDLPAARTWFHAAWRRVPAYALALGNLAEVDAALGDKTAIDRLRSLASSSDDPQYAASLACFLDAAGHSQEAEQWRGGAAARYDELGARHPEAFSRRAPGAGQRRTRLRRPVWAPCPGVASAS
jgi:tetratricopeptide (TPR) repeat protein